MPGKRVLAACVLAAVVGLCVFAASPTQAASVPEPIQLVEGSVVTLPQVLVTLTGQKWFFVKPLYASGPTVAVHADANPAPVNGWSVNVTGRVLSASGKLFVYATRLELLIDPRTQMPCPPPVAGSVWADVRDIPLNLDAPTEGLAPPDPSSLIPIREPVEAAPGSIALALTRSDAGAITAMDVGHGSPDSSPVTLTGKVVTATRADFAPGYMYVEETNRTAGIRVKWSGAYEPTRGDVVDVSGVIDTASDGERVIDADTGTPHGVTFVQTGTPLTPLGMTNRSLGGGPFGPYSPGVDGGVGLFNKGLLVKTTGRVSSIDEPNKLFYITDGSLADALKVSWDWPAGRPSIVPPQVGWKIGVTGLASSEVSGGSMLRVLRPRDQSDLGVYEPADTTDPTIEIISPKGTTWHKASGATFIVISGTANDDDTCVVKVEVKIGAGQYQPAVYDPVAKTWQYTWSPATFPASTTIQAKATDFAGNDAETSVSVTISSVSVIYVNGAMGDNANDGLTWATAKMTLMNTAGQQGALSAASVGTDVWVAEGTYVGPEIVNDKGLLLYGGFLGAEAVREERDWALNETVLERGQGLYVTAVITISGENPAVVDGFTIRNPLSPPPGHYITRGIQCTGPATIAHNLICGNKAANSQYDRGGGLYIEYCSGVVIAGNVIVGNTAPAGSAIGAMGASVQILNNTIIGNTATRLVGLRGAILFDFGTVAMLTNNIVAYNTGDGYYGDSWDCTATFQNNDFYQNGTYHYNESMDGSPVGTDLTPIDPGIPGLDQGDWHIWWDSPCRDAGLDSAPLPMEWDIDAEARHNGPIDIGADETTECRRYWMTLAPDESSVSVNTPVTVTAHVLDAVPQVHPAAGLEVEVHVDAGQITSVTRNGVVAALPTGTQSTYGITGTDGIVEVVFTVTYQCDVHVTLSVEQCSSPVGKTVAVSFYACDWPMFMRDPQHTGRARVPDTSPESLTLAWSAGVQTAWTDRSSTWLPHNQPGGSSGGHIFRHPFIDSSPVVVGDMVIVGTWTRWTQYGGTSPNFLPYEPSTSTGSLVAFNGASGVPLWTATGSPAMGGVASTPCVSEGRAYVGAANGYLYCFSAATGSQLWAQPTYDRSAPALLSKILASPVAHEGVVYIGNEAAKLYAFDAATGAPLAGYPVVLPIEQHMSAPGGNYTLLQRENMTGVSSPAIATLDESEYLLFGCDDGYVYRITLGTANPQSTLAGADLGYCVESSPTVVDNEVYVGISRFAGNEIYRLSIDPLQPLGCTAIGEECRATPAHDGNGFLYAGVDTGNTFHKLTVTTLSPVTAFDAGPPHYFVGSAAVCGNGLVYVGNDNGMFYALSRDDLSNPNPVSYSQYQYSGCICSSPAIAYNVDADHNRWVYVTTRNGSGKLLAFETVRQ